MTLVKLFELLVEAETLWSNVNLSDHFEGVVKLVEPEKEYSSFCTYSVPEAFVPIV